MKKMLSLLIVLTMLVITPPLALADVNFTGDFRYRHNSEYVETQPDQNSHYVRFRLGMEAMVNEMLDFNLRFATGVDNPISSDQKLADGFAPKEFGVDQVYLNFHPYQSMNFYGGKFAVPYVHTDLLFDEDLNFEGLAACFHQSDAAFMNDQNVLFSPFLNLGGFWLDENIEGADQGLFGGQIGADFSKFSFATAYYDYGNLKDMLFDLPFGNTVDFERSEYLRDYDLWDTNVQLILGPFTIYGNYVRNMVADTSNSGWLVGLKTQVKWANVTYNYRVLEPDAVVGAFTNNEFGAGGTDCEGHKISVALIPLENTEFKATYFLTVVSPDNEEFKAEYNRLMLDFNIWF